MKLSFGRWFYLFSRKKNITKDSFEGIGITVLLIILLVVISANIIRVVERGMWNYGVYRHELASLQEEQARNQILKEDLQYYRSTETKILQAKEILGLAADNEQLIRIKEYPRFFTSEQNAFSADNLNGETQWSTFLNFLW